MIDTPKKSLRATHNVAAEVNRALGSCGLSIADLSAKIKESERFIREILVGEDHLDRRVNMRLLQEIANATGRTLNIKIPPNKVPSHKSTVKSGE